MKGIESSFFFDIFKDQEIRPKNCLDQYRGDESSKILLTQPMPNLTLYFLGMTNIW